MNKQTRIVLIVGVAAVAVYLLYRYISKRGNEGTGSGPLGTNLNSVAPELIGGSSGPSQGPAVDVPVTINVTDTSSESTSKPSTNAPIRYRPANNQTDAAAIGGMNTPVAHASTSGQTGTPMRTSAASRSPMTAQHRAAGHPAVTGQAKANMAGSESGGTRPRVPSPSSHAAHHTSDKSSPDKSSSQRVSPTSTTTASTHANPTTNSHAKAPVAKATQAKGRSSKAKTKAKK